MEELELLFAIQPDPPTEIRLFGFGETETSKGKFVLDRSAAQMLMDKYREQGTDRLAFDYGHGMVKPTGADSHKAAGWFVPEVREDGIYASDIQWTDPALKALREREYRFFSPAFLFDKSSRKLTKLLNVALTNMPATKNQSPLVLDAHSETETNKELEKMQVLLDSLNASDEAGAVAKLGELRAELSEVNEKNEKFQALAAEAQSELAELKKERAAEKRATQIEALCSEGKLLEGQKQFAALLSDDQFSAFEKTLKPHPALTAEPISEKKSEAATLSDDEQAEEDRILGLIGVEESK